MKARVPGYKAHDGSLAGWEPQGGQGHVSVEQAQELL